MKQLFLIALILSLTTFAYANDEEDLCADPVAAGFYNECNKGHKHKTVSRMGAGPDVVLWESEKEEPFIEELLITYRYESNSGAHETYIVPRINLWNKVKNTRVVKKIKGWFSDE